MIAQIFCCLVYAWRMPSFLIPRQKEKQVQMKTQKATQKNRDPKPLFIPSPRHVLSLTMSRKNERTNERTNARGCYPALVKFVLTEFLLEDLGGKAPCPQPASGLSRSLFPRLYSPRSRVVDPLYPRKLTYLYLCLCLSLPVSFSLRK